MAVDLSTVGLKGLEVAAGLRQSEATTRSTNATAAGQEIENQQAEMENRIQSEALAKLSSVARGGKGSDGTQVLDDTSDPSKGAPLEQIGALMIAGGAIKRGTEYLKAGVEIRKKESDMLNDVESRQKTRLDNIISVSDLFSRTFGTARNQSEWDYAIKQMEADPSVVEIFGNENFEALKSQPFDPNVAEFLNERAMDAKDRASLELQQQGYDRQVRSDQNTESYRRATLEISRGNLDARNREAAIRNKADGPKASTSPTDADLKAAETSIANLIFNGKVPAKDDVEYVAFKSGAQDIASQARQLVQENKALDFNAAITRVTLQSKTNGDWLQMTPADERGFMDRLVGRDAPAPVENARYRGRGMKAIDAVEMPTDKAQLKSGSYYITPRGVAKWDGTNFVKDEQ